jgi:hypothetical protein
VSAPVTTAFDQEMYRVKSELEMGNYSKEDIEGAIAYTRQFKKLVNEGKPYSQFLELQTQIDKYKWAQTVIRGDEMIYEYLDVILREDHVPSIRNYHCPMLAVWGENDLLVPPIKSSETFEKEMKAIKNSNAKIKVISKADHTLTFNLTGKREETISRREHYTDNPALVFAPGAVQLMTDWLNELYPKR